MFHCKKAKKIALLLVAACALSTGANAEYHRSKAALRAFIKEQACPSTGEHRFPCPGYVVDHRVGLCVGGPDSPDNMRWMTKEAAKAKDKWECRPGWESKLEQCELAGDYMHRLCN